MTKPVQRQTSAIVSSVFGVKPDNALPSPMESPMMEAPDNTASIATATTTRVVSESVGMIFIESQKRSFLTLPHFRRVLSASQPSGVEAGLQPAGRLLGGLPRALPVGWY